MCVCVCARACVCACVCVHAYCWEFVMHFLTYLIIPASNEASHHVELTNIQAWAEWNNLRLNCSELCEVIFTDSRHRRRCAAEPALLPGITCSHSLKILGIDIENDFSVSQYMQQLVTVSVQITTRCACCSLMVSVTPLSNMSVRPPRRTADVCHQRVVWPHQGI